MSDRTALSRLALRAAMQLRRSLAIPREAAVNAFDIAQMCGLDVRFLDIASLEGMFVRDPGLRVLLPSLKHRPRGRVLYSCAHELGHHEFGHGTKADEYLVEGTSPAYSDEEYLANQFAPHLLMPRNAVLDAFARRKWTAERASAHQVYHICGELGVGYVTLLNHMTYSLNLLARPERDRLARIQPKTLKADLTGDPNTRRVLAVDSSWKYVPVDAECGETVILPEGIGTACPLLELQVTRDGASHYIARTAGEDSIELGTSKVALRVARQHYVGPYVNRYLADPDEH